MVEQYELLLGQDEKWKTADRSAINSGPLGERVAYWMYRLRDLAAEQSNFPGRCNVVGSHT